MDGKIGGGWEHKPRILQQMACFNAGRIFAFSFMDGRRTGWIIMVGVSFAFLLDSWGEEGEKRGRCILDAWMCF